MDHTLSSPRERIPIAAAEFAASLRSALAWALAKARAATAPDRLTDRAVAILTDPSSSLDDLDWAERTLCGLCHKSGVAELKARRWQS